MIKKVFLVLVFFLVSLFNTKLVVACDEGDTKHQGRTCYECVYNKRKDTSKWKSWTCATEAEEELQAQKAAEAAYLTWLAAQTAAANAAGQLEGPSTGNLNCLQDGCGKSGCASNQIHWICRDKTTGAENDDGCVSDPKNLCGTGFFEITTSVPCLLPEEEGGTGQVSKQGRCEAIVGNNACQPVTSSEVGSCGSSGKLMKDNCGGVVCEIGEEERQQRQSSCTPACTPACGQGNLCGGTCSNVDDGLPVAPTLTPVNGGTATPDTSGQVTVSWTAVGKAEQYQIELFPSGTDCTDPAAYCNTTSALNYSFPPNVSTYSYRVRGVNTSCGFQPGAWGGPAVFTVNSAVSGQVKLDLAGDATLVGGICTLSGAVPIQPGAESRVVVDSTYVGVVGVGGSYSVSVPAGLRTSVLVPDSDWRCTCPVGCAYSTIAPKTGLDYFVSNFRNSWFQVTGGSLHADAGGITSRIPSTCVSGLGCDPYLIKADSSGAIGVASYTSGGLNLGDVDENNVTEGDDWRAQTAYDGTKTGYGYFSRILQEDPNGLGEWNGSQPVTSGVFLANAVSEISGGDWNISAGQTIVLLVPNDLMIKLNINVASGGFLAIITSGNLTFGDDVNHVEGVYIADGVVATCELDVCGLGGIADQFTGEGIFVGWQGFDFKRDFYSSFNNTAPAEIFVYRPDLQVNAYRYLLNPKYTWQEVAP